MTTSSADIGPRLVIRPRKGWAPVGLREVWEFRDLLYSFAGRDIRLRYRQTALGVIWVVLQPLLGAGILSFVFGKVAKLPTHGVPYFVFAYVGMLAWSAFSSTLTKASGSLVGNSTLVSKVFFPRILLPLAVLGSTLVDFAVALTVMAALLVISGVHVTWAVLTVPVWLVLVLVLAQGVGLITASLMVRYRDVQYVLPVIVQFLLFASPVAYGLDAIPAPARSLYQLNPLVGLMEAFRWALLHVTSLPVGPLLYSAVIAFTGLFVGAALFSRLEREFADVI